MSGKSLWLNGGKNKSLGMNKLVQDCMGKIFSRILPVLTDRTVATIEGIRVYMACYRCLAENQHCNGGKEPTAITGRTEGGYTVHIQTLKLMEKMCKRSGR